MNRPNSTKTYMLVVIGIATAEVVYSAIRLPLNRVDAQFLVLVFLTIAISSRLTVRIPRVSGHISVSDTFLFLTMLFYGGEAAVLLAVAETLCSSLRFSKKEIRISPLTIAFNCGMMATSAFVTFSVVSLIFGDPTALRHGQFSAVFVAALCTMALVQ